VIASPDPATALRRDPLTSSEIDQLRAVAAEPAKRLHLLITFCQSRLATLDRIVADPAQGALVETLIGDLTAIVDEIDDNLDQLAGRPLNAHDKADVRTGMQEWIRVATEFEAKLKTHKIPSSVPAAVLQEAQEAVKSSKDVTIEYLRK
jgi:hypothetical protein